MTTPGLPSSPLPAGWDWIPRELKALRREVQQLRAARSLESASIGAGIDITNGAVRIRDGSGDVVVQLGLLPDDTFGLAAVDPGTGQLVTLTTLAFGMRAARNTSVLSIGASTWDDPDIGDAGPTISGVPIGTAGRCLVILSAALTPGLGEGDTGEIQMSMAISGATSRSPGGDVVLGLGRSASGSPGGIDVPAGEMAAAGLAQNLNAGSHTFTAKYQNTSLAGDSTIHRATMIIIPF